jgi:signal peptidase I
LGFALLSYFFFSHFVVTSVQVVGGSMYPTLHDSERYLLNRWIYLFRSPKPGDIVVIQDPSDDRLSVKRIIACSGQSVGFKQGTVFVNGKRIEEPYLLKGTKTFPEGPGKRLSCGPGQFVLLGDNRMNSVDSRVYGPVQRERILGLIVR